MTARTRTDSLLLAGFCAFLFFYGLAQFGSIGADEPRYAQVAQEMLERHDWITPTLGGHPWLEKPPLYYWQAMLAYSIFGVSDRAARVPSAIDATLLVLAFYFFLRRFRPTFELDGALIAASCAGIMGYARAASMDMALSATFSGGLLAWWAWRESGKKLYLAAFYACMALGTLAKGPVAPFLAVLVIGLYAATVRGHSGFLACFCSAPSRCRGFSLCKYAIRSSFANLFSSTTLGAFRKIFIITPNLFGTTFQSRRSRLFPGACS
jgi:4-amino-4-deoxy-L-arabinose transferase-like glycosyltransferase